MTDYKKVFVDTAPFIYFIEKDVNNPQYFEKVKKFFMNGYGSNKEFVTSVITMEEYFVFPYRNNNHSYIDMFNRLVATTNMEIVEINQEIAKKSAQIRAEYKGVRRHIVGGANRTLISALSSLRLCRTGTCRRLQTE